MIKSLYKKLISEKVRVKFIQKINRLFSFYYFGNKVYCNLCNQTFRKFKSKGNNIIVRRNAVCPKCESLERTRVLNEFLKNETEIFLKPLKVLHIAPEKCIYDLIKKTNCEYIDGDINPALATHQIDITDIKYSDNYFDLIICAHVLGHVPDEKKAISELYRVLNTTGKLIVQTLIGKNSITLEDNNIILPHERLKIYGEHDLVRLHGLDFSNRLKIENTKVTTIDYKNTFTKKEQEKFCFGDGQRELIFLCKKNA